MASSAKDIQFKELKDTISQLNTTIRTQNDLIVSLQKMLEERNAKDDEKDRIISNLQAQLEYFKQKLFGSSSERRSDLPGQLSLFSGSGSGEEPLPELIEPEFIEVKTSKQERKPKADYDEMFANLPIHYEEVNTLSEEEKQCSECGAGMIPIAAMKRYGQNSVIPGQNWSVSCTLPPLMGVQPVKTRRIRGS